MIPSRALLLAIALAAASCARPASDQDFVKDAVQGDISEVTIGQLAQQKAASSEVRDFGNILVVDHTEGRSRAEALASALGVTPPTDMISKANDEYNKLQKLSGDDFDKEFVRYMVEDHKADIAEFTQAAKSKDARVSAFAQNTLPVLQKHLDEAQALQIKS